MFHSFQLLPSTPADSTITHLRPQTDQDQRRDPPDDNRRMGSSAQHTLPFSFYPTAKRDCTTPVASTSQQTQDQLRRLPSFMDSLYKLPQNEPSEDEGDLSGPED